MFPVVPGEWNFSNTIQSARMKLNDDFTTEELISGLGKLNSKL